MEKLNVTQQKHTFSNQTKCNTTQNKHKKTKVRFSRLLRHPAWKRRRPILVLALHKVFAYLIRHLPTYLQPGTHTGPHSTSWLAWHKTTYYKQTSDITSVYWPLFQNNLDKYQKGATNLDFSEASWWGGSGISWTMQIICTLLQTDNHASSSSLKFLQAGFSSWRPTNSDKALKAKPSITLHREYPTTFTHLAIIR